MSAPTIVYDDDCGFCTWTAEWADRHGTFEVVGFSDLTPELRERLPEGYEECVHLLTDDAVYSCGEATEQILARTDVAPAELFEFLRQFSDYERAREWLYRWGADRRDVWGKLLSASPPVGDRRDGRG